jgi:hypothetical protein
LWLLPKLKMLLFGAVVVVVVVLWLFPKQCLTCNSKLLVNCIPATYLQTATYPATLHCNT